MYVICPDCGKRYDDAARWTICPHNHLDMPAKDQENPMTNTVAESTPIVLPTPGRIVHMVVAKDGKPDPAHPPIPAGVVRVTDTGRVCLDAWGEHDGHQPSVELRRWELLHVSEVGEGAWAWDWMPYQVGQAKKVEEVAERRLGLARKPTDYELSKRFMYHAPKPDQPAKYIAIRNQAHTLADLMAEHCPPSDELARALDHLDNAVFNANAAIARHG